MTPRDRMWAAIRSFGLMREFALAEIMVLTEQRADTTLSYLDALAAADFVRETRRDRHPRRECRRFELLRDVGVNAPRVNREGDPVGSPGHQAMWNVMRRERGRFGWRDLVHRASTTEHRIDDEVAQVYVRQLTRAGYLRREQAPRAGIEAQYVFVRQRDTGPRAPTIGARRSVRDGNTGELVYGR